MGGIAVKKGNASTSYTGTKYQFDAGVKHLYIRTSTGANDVISYPLTTETSASQYCSLAFKVGDQTCYLASRTSGDTVFQTLPSGNVSTTNSNTQRVQLDSQTYIDSAHGFSTATYYRYSTQSNYSLRNSANQTYTSTNFIINTEGITKSSSATYTVQQVSSSFITSTSNSNATSSRTDNSVVGMPIYNSSTYQISTGTSPANYNTTRVANYTSTYYNNTGYGTVTSSSTASSYTMGSAYQTSYAATDTYGIETSKWINLISEVTDTNGNIATSWQGTHSSRWDEFSAFTGYQSYTKHSNYRTASTSGNYEGYYITYVNYPKFDGQTFYSASTNSNTTKFSEYTASVTIYTATSEYASTAGTTKVTYGSTQTHYYYTTLNNVRYSLEVGYELPNNYTTSLSLQGNSNYSDYDALYDTISGMYSQSDHWTSWLSRTEQTYTAKLDSSIVGQGITNSTVGATKTTWTWSCVLGSQGNSTRVGAYASSTETYGKSQATGAETKASGGLVTAVGAVDNTSQRYIVSSFSLSSVETYITRTSKKSGAKYAIYASAVTRSTKIATKITANYYKKYLVSGYEPSYYTVYDTIYYGNSHVYTNSTYTNQENSTVGRTTRDITHYIWTRTSTKSRSSSAYLRSAATSTTYSNNVTSESAYQTTSEQTNYSTQSRYTQTSSTKLSSYSSRTYYTSSTKFTFTKTTSSHNANI